jgi:hypothetical protein
MRVSASTLLCARACVLLILQNPVLTACAALPLQWPILQLHSSLMQVMGALIQTKKWIQSCNIIVI